MNVMKVMPVLAAMLLTACDASGPAATDQPVKSVTPAAKLDMSGLVAEVDANTDGKMSRDEWKAKGLPDSSFNGMTKGQRDYVTQADYDQGSPPPGIDGNGDGKLTVAEFVAFDKKGPPKGPPPSAN